MNPESAIQARLTALESAIHQAETDRRDLWQTAQDARTAAAVQARDIAEIREDFVEIRMELRWVKRGMWAAAAFFATTTIAVSTLLLNHL